MRRAFLLALALVSCAPSAAQVRSQNVAQARLQAQQVAGARQAQALAEAVHAAYVEGDYKGKPQQLQADAGDAVAVIDRALPQASLDAPTLVAWRGLMNTDLGRYEQAGKDLQQSFQMAPNALAGRNLIVIYGAANLPDRVGATCSATFPVMRTDDDRLDLIALCRKHMNAASPEGEMAWMTRDQIAWYQAENARRIQADIDAQNARAERDRYEQRVVRQTEQCAATCKERGLTCQNDCDQGDQVCDNRCVELNHACLDRCESRAYEKLDQ